MPAAYSAAEIDTFIERIHREVGDGPFQCLGLIALEALIRKSDTRNQLPGKTLLRERINAFRSARWPALTPKKSGSRRYW